MQKYVISISRRFGSLGRPMAKKLAEILLIEYYDRDIVEEAAKVHNIPLKEASDLVPRDVLFISVLFHLAS